MMPAVKELPEQLLRALGVDAEFKVAALPGNENENCLVKTSEQSFVVKRLRGHTASNTELEGVYRRSLADARLPVAPYISLSNGSYVLTHGEDSYVATPYADGKMATPNTQLAIEAATVLANVHSLDFAPLPKRQSWYRKNYISDSLDLINDRYAGAKRAFTLQQADTPDFWSDNLPKGIIHGDLQEDNIIVSHQDRIVGVIDWEEVAIEPLLLDVAHSAQQLSFKNRFNQEVIRRIGIINSSYKHLALMILSG